MKLYFVLLPVIASEIANAATTHSVNAGELEKRFLNVMHAELGKVNAERKEAKAGKTANCWANIKIKKGFLEGSQKQTQVLTLEDGKTINTRVVDVYRYSAAVVKFEEEFGADLVGTVPPAIANWVDTMAQRLAAKAAEPIEA